MIIFVLSCKDAKPKLLVIGTVDKCRKNPQFLSKYNIKTPVYIDLRQKSYKGFTIIEARENGKKLRLPSWQSAGNLGAYTMDDKGNIYISPMPHVSLYNSPLRFENILYKVDTKTGVMDSVFRVDFAKPPHNSNPYGITGMTYDCESNYLYTSSVAGSTIKEEIGIIQKVDVENKKVVSSFKNVDAIGITLFKTRNAKRLYYGLARHPEIYSISLDESGNFKGESRFEISLVEAKGGSFDKAHKLSINGNIMTIKAIEFNYTLMAASDPQRNIYRYKYDKEMDEWIFIDVKKQ